LDLISESNWTDSGIKDFKKSLKELKIEFKNKNELNSFIEGMQRLNNTFGQYDEQAVIDMANSLEEAKKLTRGDTIEEELYESLLAISENASQYFSLMQDGTYILTKDAEEFYNMLKDASRDNLEKNFDDALTLFDETQEKANDAVLDFKN